MRTDAVARAAEVMIKYFGWRRNHTEGRATELTVKMLRAALKDPNDPDWLARQLYVLSNTHDGTTIPRWTPEEALRVWNSLSDDAWVKVHYRMVADGFRILITGKPV